jgi:mycothiol system anti-sigma-R factor
MTCHEVRLHVPAYVDGELEAEHALAVGAHAAECLQCAAALRRERQFRAVLRRQPREAAPAELRTRILARCRRDAWRRRLGPWAAGSGVAVAAAALLLTVLWPAWRRSEPLVPQLLAAHIAFAQIERPAEFAATDRETLEAWFRQRADLRVVVPDYTPAGIRLLGGRITEFAERRAAYVLYEKGHTLLSVFAVPVRGVRISLPGGRVTYRGQAYVTYERGGYRTVSWTEDEMVFGLVSTLDYSALLECADRLREERTARRV